MSAILDRFQKTDDLQILTVQALVKLIDTLEAQNKKKIEIRQGNLSKLDTNAFDKLEKNLAKAVLSNPSYYGSHLGHSKYSGFRGTSATVKTAIITMKPSPDTVALLRKLSCPYAATSFGTLNWDITINGSDLLGDGIIDNPHWIENAGVITADQEVVIHTTETDVAQNYTALLEYLEIPQKAYTKIQELYQV